MNNMINIEVEKIIEPTPASDGAGVKLKRSIGVEPNYYDPFLMLDEFGSCLLYTSPSPRDATLSRMPSSA